jgi:hypothetical protein
MVGVAEVGGGAELARPKAPRATCPPREASCRRRTLCDKRGCIFHGIRPLLHQHPFFHEHSNRRLLEPIGQIPPAEAEQRYFDQLHAAASVARTQANQLPANPGRFISCGTKSAPRPDTVCFGRCGHGSGGASVAGEAGAGSPVARICCSHGGPASCAGVFSSA